MILSSMTEYYKYDYKNYLWQLALNNYVIDAITEHTLIREPFSGTITRVYACDWASNPLKLDVELEI